MTRKRAIEDIIHEHCYPVGIVAREHARPIVAEAVDEGIILGLRMAAKLIGTRATTDVKLLVEQKATKREKRLRA